jgi:hypothetical protein
MASDRRLESRRKVVTVVATALGIYLYSVGFFLGTRGSPDMAQSIATGAPSAGDLAVMFAVMPFFGLPGFVGLPYAVSEGPYGIIGTVFAAVVLYATYRVLNVRGLRTWRLLLLPLCAYALGYGVEYVLTAYLGVRAPPMSF